MTLNLFQIPDPPAAIFAYSDTQTMGVIEAAGELSLSVPDDLSVIGFDNIEAAEYLHITTIRQALLESGVQGAELLPTLMETPPADTTLATFVWLSGMRWPIEACFENVKQEISLGDDQVRSWTGWHSQMTLCILAYFFLVRLQLYLHNDDTNLALPQSILLVRVALGQPQVDAAKAIDTVSYCQRRHHEAYFSHRKRRSHLIETKVSLKY